MKKILAILSVMAACSTFTTNSLAADKPKDEIEFLYIQSAKTAALKPAKGSSDTFKLTLKHVQPHVVCFSERPKRIAKAMTTKEFIEEWTHPPASAKNTFKDDSPNADLNGINVATKEQINIPLELSDPQYNDRTKTLTYTVNKLQGEPNITAMNLSYVTLIIDDYAYCTRCRPM